MFNLNQADSGRGNTLGLTGLGEITLNGEAVATLRSDLSRAAVSDFERLVEAVTELDEDTVDDMTQESYNEGFDEGMKQGYDNALDYAAQEVEDMSEALDVFLSIRVTYTEEQLDDIYAAMRRLAHDIRNMEYK
jgi:soluble cytochrome b562